MIECIKYTTHIKGYLQGFADFYIHRWGVELSGCSLYMKNGQRWLNLPSKEYQNADGEQKYAPIVRFREKEHYDAFIVQAKQAIDEYCLKNPQTEEPAKKVDPGDSYGFKKLGDFISPPKPPVISIDSECPF